MLGAQLGQYRILSVVGGGGMGVVFRAKQETVDRDVALKLLPPELAHDEINSKRLEREAKALAKLNHPNIVTTFDFGLTEYGQAYLVMELVDGECLKEILLRDTRIELGRALKIFIQLADAMRFAHASGIVHRDLKPHNVMLAQNPSPDFVKVLDFGIATLADSQKLTRVGEIIGSPLYMSPEQCLSDPVDERTDIYALGVLMYLSLTGTVPFKGNTLYETVEAKCTHPIPRFKDVAPHVEIPGFLEELIRHCLAVEPKDRFQSMDEVKDLLESIPVPSKKALPMESTMALGAPPVVPKSAPAARTIKDKMQDNAIQSNANSDNASRSSAAPASNQSGSSSRAMRPQPKEAQGIVLTPGMLMIGFVLLIAMLFAGVVVGVSFVSQGTFLPVHEKPNAAVNTSKPVDPMRSTGDTDSGAPKPAGDATSPSNENPQAAPHPASGTGPATPSSALPSTPAVQTKPVIRQPQQKVAPPTHVKEQKKKPVLKPSRKVVRPASDPPARPSHLPSVRHFVPPVTDSDRWYNFNR
jgi:serine/threonine-protein kinase